MAAFDTELFINIVKEKRVFWDKTHKQFHNRLLTHREWEKVGKTMNSSGEVAKKKWRNLRDTYAKELKKNPKQRSGASADEEAVYTGHWAYFECMEFLKGILKPRKTESNVTMEIEPEGSTFYFFHDDDDSTMLQASQIEQESESILNRAAPEDIEAVEINIADTISEVPLNENNNSEIILGDTLHENNASNTYN